MLLVEFGRIAPPTVTVWLNVAVPDTVRFDAAVNAPVTLALPATDKDVPLRNTAALPPKTPMARV